MSINVVKRDDRQIVEFDRNKIATAINKAAKAIGLYKIELANQIAKEIEEMLIRNEVDKISIYNIEKIVFFSLIDHKEPEIAKAYESYKSIRAYQRENNTTDSSIAEFLQGLDEETLNENSNKNGYVNSTQRDLVAGIISKDIARRKLIPTHLIEAHDNGAIHIHDMDYMIQPMTNCCLINIGDMLRNGTVINKKKINKPRSFQVACTVMTQIIAQVASNQYGGQSVDIKHLAEFVDISRQKYRKLLGSHLADEKTITEIAEALVRKEIKSGVQTIQYQVNTLMTTNGQAPFVTIFLDIEKKNPYHKDLELIIEEILNQRLEGIENECGVKITTAFPKLVYVLNEDTSKGGDYYHLTKLAAKCTAKRMYPDYISKKKMEVIYKGSHFSPMGCRSFLTPWINENGEYQFEGRLNFGVQTLNIPQIAIIANGDIEKFWIILKERLDLIKEVGLIRYNLLRKVKAKVSPIHWQHGAIARLQPDEEIGKLLVDGRSTISVGYIGLHEAVIALGFDSITTDEGHKMAKEILKFIEQTISEWRKQTNLYFSIYGTPSESTAGRLCEIDIKNFGIIEGVTDKGYYTNSYHVTPSEEIDAFTKLKLEAEFQELSTGGCISYIEIPNMTNNVEAIEAIIDFMYNNITYAEFNTKSDYCQVCGFDGEIIVNDDLEWECPQCHNKDKDKLNVIRRTCGYLGENFWSKGRTKDIKDRVLHI